MVNHPMKSRFGKVCLSAVSTGSWWLFGGGGGVGGTLIKSRREEDVVDVPFYCEGEFKDHFNADVSAGLCAQDSASD